MSQLNRASFKNLYGASGTTFPDNTTQEISEGDMRTFGADLADSFLNKSDDLVDEDDMSSDSATKVPSQQSVKAYVDAQAGGAPQYIEVDISSVEILALHATPKELIAAPGADKMIKILHAAIIYTFGTTQYTTGGLGNLVISYYGDGSHSAMSVPGSIMTQTASCMAPGAAATTLIPFSEGENEGVSVIASSQLSSGDGTLKCKIWYEIIDLV